MIVSLAGLPVFVEVFWKSGVVLGAGLSIGGLLRRKSADLRRLVLSTAVVAMFVAAMLWPALPRWSATVPDWIQFGNRTAPMSDGLSPEFRIPRGGIGRGMPISRPDKPGSGTQIYSAAWPPNWIPGPIPLIWFCGSLALLARFAVSLVGLHRLRNASEGVTDFDLPANLRSAMDSHAVALQQSEAIPAPATWGIFRPVILVPARFEQLPIESRNAVLSHELAHIQGHDFFMRVLVEVARAVLWFQPLIWIVRRQLRVEQELACDNRVLASGGRPSTYAKLLMDWADPTPANDVLLAVGMAHRSSLNRRLFALLDRDQQRDAVSATGVLAICAAGLAAALPLAAIGFTHAIPAPPAIHAAPTVAAPFALLPPRIQMAQVQRAPAPVRAPAPQPVAADAAALPKFSTNVMLVIEDVAVSDKTGKAVEGLRPDDFVLTEDGMAQTISLFEFQKLDVVIQKPDGASQTPVSYYILGYYTSNLNVDGSYRKIKVALKDDTADRADFRLGYYTSNRVSAAGGDVYMVDGVTCHGCDNSVGPGVTFPVLISETQPAYSDQARKAKYSGTVTLNIGVDASGQVTDIKVAKSLGMGLDEQAVGAVQQWKFKPGMKDGTPVTVRVQVDVNFRLL